LKFLSAYVTFQPAYGLRIVLECEPTACSLQPFFTRNVRKNITLHPTVLYGPFPIFPITLTQIASDLNMRLAT
jgi:hypothetical protein